MRIKSLLGFTAGPAVLLAFALLPATAEPPADGFYRPQPAEGAATQETPPLGQALPLRIDHALMAAQDNRNEDFSLDLRVPYDPALSQQGSLLLAVGGQVYVSAGAGSSGTTWSHPSFALRGRESAAAVAKFLGITPHLRRHPGHRLEIAFVPEKPKIPMGKAPKVTFRMKNVGEAPVAFVNGGRNRAPRDNQYDFMARLAGHLVPDIGIQANFGGRSQRQVLQPGETFEEEIDLARWFNFEMSGLYEILGTYALTLLDPATDDHVPLWEDYAAASCLIEVAPGATDQEARATPRFPDREGAMVGDWTDAVRGIRARLVTSLDDLDRGGAFVSVYVELEHVHPYSSQIEIGADRQVEIELLDDAMRPVPPQGFPYDGPVEAPASIVLPNHSRIRYKVSSGGCGTPPGGVMVCFLHANWFIPDKDQRTFYVRGTLRSEGKGEGGNRWTGRLVLPPTPLDRQPN